MNQIDQNVYKIFDCYSKYIVFWLAFFTILTFINLLYDVLHSDSNILSNTKLKAYKENIIIEELPGITFILLHTLCFFIGKDISSKILYLYWGPLFFLTAYFVLFKINVDWKSVAVPSSILCKSFYVIFVSIFLYLGYTMPVYCYSLWIMSDQIRLAWWKNNADRSRRLFEDYFIPRIGYPLFLFLPFVDDTFYHKEFFMPISIGVFTIWLAGIYRLVQNGTFFEKPKIDGFGRDIVYL